VKNIPVVDHSQADIAAKILAIQLAACTVEVQLLGISYFPPLHESIADIQARHWTHRGAFLNLELAGCIASQFHEHTGELEIRHLVVDPQHHRKGVGKQLLAHTLQTYPFVICTLQTGAKNVPAISLYQSFGFFETERRLVGVENAVWVSLALNRS
jgi:ribosomal protein S18 acetylase RimI-like enzyme